MRISVNQIDQNQLSLFIQQTASGQALSGNLYYYFAASGWAGPNVVYTTGGIQGITGTKVFLDSPVVPYSGNTGTAPSAKFVIDSINLNSSNLSGYIDSFFVSLRNNDIISGYKIFTGAIQIGSPVRTGDAVNLLYLSGVSGILQNSINTLTISNTVNTTGDQFISGQKTFQNSPYVPIPTNGSGAVPKSYVDSLSLTGVVYTTGAQNIEGVKTFTNSPIVPIALNSNEAVQKAQLDALGITIGGVTGFAGVLSLNGSSGASGHLYLEGAGTVTVNQCGSIFYISGNTANNTQLYSVRLSLPNGITGINYSWGTGFISRPTVVGNLEFTGSAGINFISHTIYGTTASGFSVAFSSGIPNSNYVFAFNAIPFASGLSSGFLGLQGQQGGIGPYLNPRGNWTIGAVYGYLDAVYQINNNASYFCKATHTSDSFNQPGGTGTAFWQLLATGTPGATGSWIYKGNFDTGAIYQRNFSVYYEGSSYGYTGTNAISGVYPNSLTGGWTYVAQKGDVGAFYNVSGGIVTGNFYNASFFFNPGEQTGLNLVEAFTSRTFTFTGFAIGCIESGRGPAFAGGGPLSGSFYVRNTNNDKTTIRNFTFNSGVVFAASGGFAIDITGLYRYGIDIISTLSGINKISVGVFGFGGDNV